MMPEKIEGLEGEIVELHAHKRLGSYGVMRAADGKFYIWNAGNIFRNFSHPVLGGKYRFDVVGWSYATNIDQIDKRPVRS